MKNTLLVFLSAILLLSSPACRKGEDDPLLSFISRENRLEGNWTLSEADYVFYTADYPDEQGNAEIINDSFYIFESAEDIDPFFSGTYEESLTINKNGSFSLRTRQIASGTSNFDIDFEVLGSWQFMEASGDYKNKERVKLIYEKNVHFNGSNSDTIDVNPEDYTYIMFLTRLANDELEYDYEYRFTESNPHYVTTGSRKYSQK